MCFATVIVVSAELRKSSAKASEIDGLIGVGCTLFVHPCSIDRHAGPAGDRC